MIVIDPISPQNALVFKAARLRALQDVPAAFGSTYARESQLTDDEWTNRARQWDGERSILYLAMEGSIMCGIAGTHLDRGDATRAHLISMWTAPEYRRRGVGRLLVDEIIAWGSRRGAQTLYLMVTAHNHPARRFYERLGFTLTGRTEPYPNDPALIELEMSRPVS